MNVLVTVASRHGATGQIGEIIAGVLRDHRLIVESHPPDAVRGLKNYDAVVLGSAVYAGAWLHPAVSFADRFATELASRPVWLFSSGPIGDPPMPAEEPDAAAQVSERVAAREHRLFAGKLDRAQLGFLERIISRALKAPAGDFRDLETIRSWADEIAFALSHVAVAQP